MKQVEYQIYYKGPSQYLIIEVDETQYHPFYKELVVVNTLEQALEKVIDYKRVNVKSYESPYGIRIV